VRAAAQGGLIKDHTLEIHSSAVTPTRADLIPSGALQRVAGTAHDFSSPAVIGEKMAANGGGFDTNWVLDADSLEAVRAVCTEPGKGPGREGRESLPTLIAPEQWLCAGGLMAVTRPAAEMYEPTSGRGVAIDSNAPGVQFYSGNFLGGNRGKDGATYAQHAGARLPGCQPRSATTMLSGRCCAGLCLETQAFPNAVNTPAFPSPVLQPGQRYHHEMVMRFFAK